MFRGRSWRRQQQREDQGLIHRNRIQPPVKASRNALVQRTIVTEGTRIIITEEYEKTPRILEIPPQAVNAPPQAPEISQPVQTPPQAPVIPLAPENSQRVPTPTHAPAIPLAPETSHPVPTPTQTPVIPLAPETSQAVYTPTQTSVTPRPPETSQAVYTPTQTSVTPRPPETSQAVYTPTQTSVIPLAPETSQPVPTPTHTPVILLAPETSQPVQTPPQASLIPQAPVLIVSVRSRRRRATSEGDSPVNKRRAPKMETSKINHGRMLLSTQTIIYSMTMRNLSNLELEEKVRQADALIARPIGEIKVYIIVFHMLYPRSTNSLAELFNIDETRYKYINQRPSILHRNGAPRSASIFEVRIDSLFQLPFHHTAMPWWTAFSFTMINTRRTILFHLLEERLIIRLMLIACMLKIVLRLDGPSSLNFDIFF